MKEPLKEYKPAEKIELPKIKKAFPKAFKKVSCPSCSQDVGAAYINLEKSFAKCGSCAVIFSIEEEMANLRLKEKRKNEILRPEGVDLFYHQGDMEITLPQHKHWIDIIGVIYLPLLAISFFIFYSINLISIFLPLLFSVGSLYSIYRVIKYRKAKTLIDINEHSLTIRHRPNNFKEDKTYLVEDIDQIYTKNRDGVGNYILSMLVNGPEGQYHQKLVKVSTLSKAKYLEQEIEKYLGIENREVF